MLFRSAIPEIIDNRRGAMNRLTTPASRFNVHHAGNVMAMAAGSTDHRGSITPPHPDNTVMNATRDVATAFMPRKIRVILERRAVFIVFIGP